MSEPIPSPASERPAIERRALDLPTFDLPKVGGGRIELTSWLEGLPGAVVIFWSSVCSHCRRYDAYLNAFNPRHPLGLAVIGCRQGESIEDLEKAHQQRRLDFPLLHDSGNVARAWGVQQTPCAFLLDPAGALLYRGAIDDFTYPESPAHRAYLEDAIASFLAGRAIELSSAPAYGCPTESVYYEAAKLFGSSRPR